MKINCPFSLCFGFIDHPLSLSIHIYTGVSLSGIHIVILRDHFCYWSDIILQIITLQFYVFGCDPYLEILCQYWDGMFGILLVGKIFIIVHLVLFNGSWFLPVILYPPSWILNFILGHSNPKFEFFISLNFCSFWICNIILHKLFAWRTFLIPCICVWVLMLTLTYWSKLFTFYVWLLKLALMYIFSL